MKAPRFIPILLALTATAAAGTWWLQASTPSSPSAPQPAPAPADCPGATLTRHAVRIKAGPETPKVLTNALNRAGEPVPVSCSTCHTTRAPNVAIRSAGQLTEFHQGLAYKHGDLSCLSCHNASDYDTLRKADSTVVQYRNVIELCAQCHGPQHRDFQAGAHGGMTGHWDLSRGPRERNTCVSCHDPHAPAYPRVKPVFAPVDRGARQLQERAAAHPTHSPAHD